MSAKIKLLIIALALVVLLAAGGIFYGILSADNQPDQSPQDAAGAATDFAVTDSNGNTVRLSDMKGKPTIVNFWATWCGYCVTEMPAFETLYKEYADKVNFMMVDLTDGVQETVTGAKEFIGEKGYTFPIYFDTEQQALTAYSAYSIPMTLFVDEKGALSQKHTGAMNEQTLRNYIENLLGGK